MFLRFLNENNVLGAGIPLSWFFEPNVAKSERRRIWYWEQKKKNYDILLHSPKDRHKIICCQLKATELRAHLHRFDYRTEAEMKRKNCMIKNFILWKTKNGSFNVFSLAKPLPFLWICSKLHMVLFQQKIEKINCIWHNDRQSTTVYSKSTGKWILIIFEFILSFPLLFFLQTNDFLSHRKIEILAIIQTVLERKVISGSVCCYFLGYTNSFICFL